MAAKITSRNRPDKILNLAHNLGVISIQAGSILTIGGLQYETDAQKTIALPVMTAHNRYQVYAVISGGDVALAISTNENSVGPVGFTSWKLIGCFMTNAQSPIAFGSFINITGTPQTQGFIEDSGSALIASGFFAFSASVTKWTMTRYGNRLKVHYRLDNANSPTGAPAAIPSIMSGVTHSETSQHVGTHSGQNAAGNPSGGATLGTGANSINFGGPNFVNSISVITGNALIGTGPTTLTGTFDVTVNQWSSKPIEEL